ncbi:hypothetical protein D3C75_767650 [compost metagenome]
MVAHAFNNYLRTGVAHGEPFTGDAADIRLTAGRSVKRRIPDNNVVLSSKGSLRRWLNNQLASGQPFTHIVIGVAFDRNCNALRYESAQTLSGRAGEVQTDRIIRQTCCPIFAGKLAAQNRADCAVDVRNRQRSFNRLAGFQCRCCQIQQFRYINCFFQAVVLEFAAEAGATFR